MLPLSEFHIAFCGIATVAATLGYACTRRATPSPAPSKPEAETSPPTLKRKLDDADEHDADAERQLRPMKRNKTPPTDRHDSEEDEWETIVAPPSYEQATAPRQPEEPILDNGTPPQEDLVVFKQDITPAREPTPPAYPHLEQPDEKGAEDRRCSTPQPSHVDLSPNEPETPPALPVTPPKPAISAKIKPTDAFSAFSGSSSPFASCTNTSGTSSLAGQTAKTTPAWKRDKKRESDVFSRTGVVNALAPSPNDAVLSTTRKCDTETLNEKPLSKSSTHLTGEEDETVDAELKGVKLFTKRGRKEFTDGIYGHVKVLTRKSTSPQSSNGDPQGIENKVGSRTRLLFRRDPLGQVSMNVGLHPTVRCYFEAAENILRVILMEQVSMDGKSAKEDVVVYALKPGRAGKADFESFAKTLCKHGALCVDVAASGGAAAS